MRALIADRQKLSANVEQSNHLAVNVDNLRLAEWQVAFITNYGEMMAIFGHSSSSVNSFGPASLTVCFRGVEAGLP